MFQPCQAIFEVNLLTIAVALSCGKIGMMKARKDGVEAT